MIIIEQLEDIEEHLSISIKNPSIKVEKEDGWLYVYCELYSRRGMTLEGNLEVSCVAYDLKGTILSKEDQYIVVDRFYKFEVLEFAFQIDGIVNKVAKVKIYPKKA